jgi:hypothetical protein
MGAIKGLRDDDRYRWICNNKDAEDVLLIQEVLTYSWSTNGDRKQGSLFQLS